MTVRFEGVPCVLIDPAPGSRGARCGDRVMTVRFEDVPCVLIEGLCDDVQKNGAVYTLDRASTTIDDVTVLRTAGGEGRWIATRNLKSQRTSPSEPILPMPMVSRWRKGLRYSS